MADHTTNYLNTFITVAPDSVAEQGIVPPVKDGAAPSIAARTWQVISSEPYRHTSDDVIFGVWADRREIPDTDRPAARAQFFSHGQPCLRSSDLGKRYGWGIHSDEQGRVALFAVGTPEYLRLAQGTSEAGPVTVTPAMRSARRPG